MLGGLRGRAFREEVLGLGPSGMSKVYGIVRKKKL